MKGTRWKEQNPFWEEKKGKVSESDIIIPLKVQIIFFITSSVIESNDDVASS